MSRPDEDDGDGSEGDRWEDGESDSDESGRRLLTWRGLAAADRRLWFEQLWSDVCQLRERYRLAVRSQWWVDELQVEALAALAAWVDRYDSGEWDDPPGKLALLFDLERIGGLLRDGIDPFHPERDRAAFVEHLAVLDGAPPDGIPDDQPLAARRGTLGS